MKLKKLPLAEIDAAEGGVEIGDAFLDQADFVGDLGEKLGDALTGGLVEVVEEAVEFFGE